MESALYGVLRCVLFVYLFFIRDLTLDSLVRFLVGQKLERKYRTPVLSLKYSI